MADLSERSAPALVGDLLSQVTDLFRKEIQLLRAELGAKADHAMAACGMILVGAIVAITALNLVAAALVAWVASLGLEVGWAALAVGVIFAMVACVLASRGIANLKKSNLTPDRTMRATTQDAALVREKLK